MTIHLGKPLKHTFSQHIPGSPALQGWQREVQAEIT
jgi:hypothetical protein